ncbi:MAG: Rrf2 family transcriptional regulator [Candidatus Omnitrophica bacterium]|nr:Rrf2 family transcriptional regulator [Candidatus Omnitrophota bacterium]
MKLLTKNSDYAIRALIYLARRPGLFISSREIAAAEDISVLFLRRILNTLLRHQLIASREGVNGGVKLTAEPKNISVAQLLRMFQGPIQLSQCLFRKRLCSHGGNCALRRRIRHVEALVAEEFEQITIQTLLDDLRGGT